MLNDIYVCTYVCVYMYVVVLGDNTIIVYIVTIAVHVVKGCLYVMLNDIYIPTCCMHVVVLGDNAIIVYVYRDNYQKG